MILEYNKYNKRQQLIKFKDKFFDLVMFLKNFYKENLKTSQTYIVQAGSTGAPVSREFSIHDYSNNQNEWQFRMSLFDDKMEIMFSDRPTNEYTKALKEIIKVHSYETKIYSAGFGYYIKVNDIDNLMLKITNDIEQYIDTNKYNL